MALKQENYIVGQKVKVATANKYASVYIVSGTHSSTVFSDIPSGKTVKSVVTNFNNNIYIGDLTGKSYDSPKTGGKVLEVKFVKPIQGNFATYTHGFMQVIDLDVYVAPPVTPKEPVAVAEPSLTAKTVGWFEQNWWIAAIAVVGVGVMVWVLQKNKRQRKKLLENLMNSFEEEKNSTRSKRNR